MNMPLRALEKGSVSTPRQGQGLENVLNTTAVRFEYVLPDRTKADYVLCDRNGRTIAVVEAKKAAINPAKAESQGLAMRSNNADRAQGRSGPSDQSGRRPPPHRSTGEGHVSSCDGMNEADERKIDHDQTKVRP